MPTRFPRLLLSFSVYILPDVLRLALASPLIKDMVSSSTLGGLQRESL